MYHSRPAPGTQEFRDYYKTLSDKEIDGIHKDIYLANSRYFTPIE